MDGFFSYKGDKKVEAIMIIITAIGFLVSMVWKDVLYTTIFGVLIIVLILNRVMTGLFAIEKKLKKLEKRGAKE